MADVLSTITGGHFPFTFRTNPNSITWTYHLNTATQDTYGGRVIQILSVNLDDLAITIEAGNGGRDYLDNVVVFFRNLIIQQRDYPDSKIVFSYPNRGYRLGIVPSNITKQDSLTNILRSMTLNFKIQEDITGVLKNKILEGSLSRLASGVGYEQTPYNYQGNVPAAPIYSTPGDPSGNPTSNPPSTLPPATGSGAFHDGAVPLLNNNPNTLVQALNYAASQYQAYTSSGPWYEKCASFVKQCYANPSSYDTTRNYAIDKFAELPDSQKGTDRNPPVGALLIWNTGTYGHVTLYAGNGNAYSTDYPSSQGNVYLGPATVIETGWHGSYVGWCQPVFP